MDSFKRGLKKINGEQNEVVSLQRFFRIYRMSPNPNTHSGLFLAELMFGWRVRSIDDELLPRRKIKVLKNTKQTSNRYLKSKDHIFSSCIFLVKKCGMMVLLYIGWEKPDTRSKLEI